MSKQEIRKQALLQRLRLIRHEMDVQLNQIVTMPIKYKTVPVDIMEKHRIELLCTFEVSLTFACLIIRKLTENDVLSISDNRRDDINALIHSTDFNFDINSGILKVKSRRGIEVVKIDEIFKVIDDIVGYFAPIKKL